MSRDLASTTARLDYLQRAGVDLAALSADTRSTSAPPSQRRLWRIKGVGRVEKQSASIREQRVRLPSEDVLIGLYGYKRPVDKRFRLAFLVWGEPSGVAIHVGTWSPDASDNLDERQEILRTTLSSLYPAIDLEDVPLGRRQFSPPPLSGLVLGIPTAKLSDPLEGALPLDRLIRALSGENWACLILAQPVAEDAILEIRNSVMNEVRSIQSVAQNVGGPSPLAELHSGMLNVAVNTQISGLAVGTWRTGVYLLGDKASYYRLASVWRGIFSGDESLPEPVRVFDSPAAGELAVNWALPDTPGSRGPGMYQHPLEYQTLLTSTQLAAYIHLPQLETTGFSVTTLPSFDVVPPPVHDPKSVQLGKVLVRGNPTQTDYAVGINSFTRHAFVAGVTGAGKTNTIFHILKQASKSNIPFAVIEPAKTEYRALIKDPNLGRALQVFTLGDELHSPFRLNPFEVVSWPKVPVGVHIDLLRSVFTASFGMWTPLPQILEQCLHAIYKDRGWDTTANNNYRLDANSEGADAFPTLSELAAKVDEVLQQSGWESKIKDDLRASLITRINALRAGSKGRMLDVQRSLPIEGLLKAPTVFELQEMGDDDDKAFLMGLLLIRLYEYRRAGSESSDLQHLLVIEEAHRLLTNVGAPRSQEEGDPRGKAVETFANLLSEIRAYGQGIIVADQIPVKLAPEIIKNTNLKIAHRVVAADDRAVLGGAMAMDESQTLALASFDRGEAAVFSEGDDAPVLVTVGKEKGDATVPNEQVEQFMLDSNIVKSNQVVFQPILPDLDVSKPEVYTALDAARAASDDPSFRRDFIRLVISITEDETALDPLLDNLVVRVHSFRQRDMDKNVMLRAMIIYASRWFAQHRGAQNGWTYAETAELEKSLREVLLINLGIKGRQLKLKSFQDLMMRLHKRTFEPFAGCDTICTQSPPVCLYRRAVADLITNSKQNLVGAWNDTAKEDRSAGSGFSNMWAQTQRASYELIELDTAQPEASKRIRLCYAQHMLSSQFVQDHNIILAELEAAS